MTGQDAGKPSAELARMQDPGADERRALGRIAVASVLAGLCPVIPVPFVDDLALRFIRKQAILVELNRGGVKPGRAQMDVYLDSPTRLLGCVAALVIYPLKKIFKKVFIFLAIKDSVDAASQTFHELWLMRHAVHTGQLTQADLTVEPDTLLPLRRALEKTAKQVDTSPLNQVLRKLFSSSKNLLRQAGRTLGEMIRKAGGTRQDPGTVERAVDGVQPSSVGQVDELASQLGDQIWAERGYLQQVEKTFDCNWERERTAASSVDD